MVEIEIIYPHALVMLVCGVELCLRHYYRSIIGREVLVCTGGKWLSGAEAGGWVVSCGKLWSAEEYNDIIYPSQVLLL